MSTAPTESSRFLGRYELVHPLGQGGMGEVFLAKISGAAGFEKPCIVKTILPTLLKDRQFLDRFHHEAKVLVHLVHSSIAQVYDMGEADGTYYMALEYVAGVDLAYLLEQARLQGAQVPVPVALFLGQRMAEGLGYAHRKVGPDGSPLGIVHRDVSPHNVMVSYEGEVKVIDFGLAKSAARSKYTLPATVMGKLGYMSPEQVRAEALDHRSDIYSCGVVLWEMLAGRSLIPHGTVGEMMAAMSQPTVPSMKGLRGDVDEALEAVVRRALAARPDERYSRSDEFARALNGELVRSGAAVGAEEVGHFVRALCPEAFAAQRQLISKVTSSGSHHRTPAPMPVLAGGTGTGAFGTGPQGTPENTAQSGFEPTMMRAPTEPPAPSNERRVAGMARQDVPSAEDAMGTDATTLRPGSGGVAGGVAMAASAAPSSGPVVQAASSGPVVAVSTASASQSANNVNVVAAKPASSRKTGTMLVIALTVLLLMVGTAVTTAHFVKGQGGPEAPTPPPPVAAKPPPPTSDKKPAPPTTAETRPTPPPVDKPAPRPEPEVVATREPLPPKRTPTPKPSAPKPAPEPVAVAPKPEKGVTYVSPEVALAVVEENGGYAVRGPQAVPLRMRQKFNVVGPAKNMQRVLLGRATVSWAGATPRDRIKARMVRLSLDDSARAATGPRFIALPEVGAELESFPDETPSEPEAAAEPSKPAPPMIAAPKLLTGAVRKAGGIGPFGGSGVAVRNLDDFVWTNCSVVKDRRQRGMLGILPPNKERAVKNFATHAEHFVEPGKVGVFCDEGQFITTLR
ncbi:protein kinase [Myxococcus llanfairpwllgwyngyllgogerychwyrndrobwllllantysiliogogogochensis]|uniref:Protein kinase n=1 Tax=Myxococcus llanfairpwllgwyngyllgogerychwyrndrobwllllantysiliogogogochensis TaxID=2590453 RepID=A0A540WJM9_9BACT|nr:serine/threonine-protein kinase [Myxococcus llanfairpwllgwyngyllgogerychwyrndrobwllllantysiliogogogochensis]TQF09232.1 protein kinase [Myxococcus llanfairpwllgwyngyllgogerychwyrndrobwllllantysiliogogogochensis]